MNKEEKLRLLERGSCPVINHSALLLGLHLSYEEERNGGGAAKQCSPITAVWCAQRRTLHVHEKLAAERRWAFSPLNWCFSTTENRELIPELTVDRIKNKKRLQQFSVGDFAICVPLLYCQHCHCSKIFSFKLPNGCQRTAGDSIAKKVRSQKNDSK